MLPRKIIIAVVVVSLLFFGYEGLSERQMNKAPNILLGLAVVGVANAIQSLKEFKQIA